MAHGANQRPLELEWLVGVLQGRSLGRVLEIGSESGGTLWLWCQIAMDDAQILAVDDDSQPWMFRELKARYPWPSHANQSLRLVEADSRSDEAREAVSEFFDGPIDFLLIDGGHSPVLVRSDWETFSPFVGPGGIVAFHDIDNAPNLGVTQFWDEVIKPNHVTAQCVDERDRGMGIGVVYL